VEDLTQKALTGNLDVGSRLQILNLFAKSGDPLAIRILDSLGPDARYADYLTDCVLLTFQINY